MPCNSSAHRDTRLYRPVVDAHDAAGNANTAGRSVDQHPLTPLHVTQPAQGIMGGQEANGNRRRFFETEMFRFGSDEFIERDGVAGKAGGGGTRQRNL